MWFVRPQLFFHCTLRPIGTVADRFNRSDEPEDIPLDLVFFSLSLSPFEELELRLSLRLGKAGIMREWNRKEFTGYTSPRLFPRSTWEGLRTSSAESESLSFHAFWTETQAQLRLFHTGISTAADSETPLSAAVPMVRALQPVPEPR